MWGIFYNSGQSKSSVEGILVDEGIANKFINMLTERTNEVLKLADPRLDSTNFGCVRDAGYIQFYEDIVDDAQSQGGLVTLGGFANSDANNMGRFYEPTIIANTHAGMRCKMEQTFGPIVGIQRVDSPGEAAKIINTQRYGLESYVFTNENDTIEQLS